MKLVVNGRRARESRASRSRPLLHVLREELGLTGPKAGCQQGGCGTCTVLVDGEPRRACLSPLVNVEGAAVTTVEGLGDARRPLARAGRLQRALRRPVRLLHAGLGPRADALLERNPSPDREEILEALGGHICRCTGYVKIIDAVEALAAETASPTSEVRCAGMKAVGARLPRYDGVAHVTGRTVYVDDVRVPAHPLGEGLRSPHDSARIRKLDTSQGRGAPRRARHRRCTRTCRRTSSATSRRSASRPTSRSSRSTRCATAAS